LRTLILQRVCSSQKHGTQGVLIDVDDNEIGVPIAVTLEKPFLDNKPFVSCIPSGSFYCKEIESPRFGHSFEITVSGRSHVIFHAGNLPRDTHGCILLGIKFGLLNGDQAILGSKTAVDNFFKRMNSEREFNLQVIDCNKIKEYKGE
jgi:hypothetical protein